MLWSAFWRFPLTHAGRNVWFRVLHYKIPSRLLLNQLIPAYFDSPLYFCLVVEPFSIEAVHIALFHLHFPGVRPDCSIADASVIICSSLLAIWRSHWAYIFDSVLFISSTTIASATRLIQQYLKEALYNQGISPLPLAHLQI
ncbi:hypothetical protein INT47_008712 [Mucor saturninus]|uniref:Uncharacterized protein n=1 Tax=Mucor saturninus TaxID=64648 RepID=A0A8H7RJE3_9FUNG|nr:hypothetical protein INT47_008712 [Mucor saturninus]